MCILLYNKSYLYHFLHRKPIMLNIDSKFLNMKKTLTIVMLLLAAVFTASGQEKEGKKVLSPKAVASKGNVEVHYSQPSMRGRKIFGGLVPYGQVWRTGANEATEITFKKDGTFAGQQVQAGTYTLYTIPSEDNWEIILNSKLGQWGAFKYESIKDYDVVEATAPAKHIHKKVETFTIEVNKHDLTLEWEHTRVAIPMDF